MRRSLALAVLAHVLAASAALAATPPAQPKSGPGGADYATAEVTRRAVGQASAPVYLFHGADQPKAARPVVVMFPAWGINNPMIYGGWIEHLARRGALVVFPRYQDLNRTRPADATALAVEMLKEAFGTLEADAAAKPDLKRVAYVGHLAGAPVAANVAALAKAEGLPQPKLVLALMPGGVAKDAKSRGIPLGDLSAIEADTLFATMTGDREHLPSDRTAKLLHREASAVPVNRKLLIRALSDDHGFPTISATLASPGSAKDDYDAAKIPVPPDPPNDPRALRAKKQKWTADMALSGEQTVLAQQLAANVTDALDYMAYWKTLDLLMAAAFSGKDGQAIRREGAIYDMGQWSDTWPVRRVSASEPAAN